MKTYRVIRPFYLGNGIAVAGAIVELGPPLDREMLTAGKVVPATEEDTKPKGPLTTENAGAVVSGGKPKT